MTEPVGSSSTPSLPSRAPSGKSAPRVVCLPEAQTIWAVEDQFERRRDEFDSRAKNWAAVATAARAEPAARHVRQKMPGPRCAAVARAAAGVRGRASGRGAGGRSRRAVQVVAAGECEEENTLCSISPTDGSHKRGA